MRRCRIEMMRVTVDGMMTGGFGRIINIVSRSVKMAQLELGLSNGARSGLVGFAAGLARQTAAHNVTINNLLPGIFDSDAQRAHVRAMLEPPPGATVGRTSSAPIAHFSARNTPASSPATIC